MTVTRVGRFEGSVRDVSSKIEIQKDEVNKEVMRMNCGVNVTIYRGITHSLLRSTKSDYKFVKV